MRPLTPFLAALALGPAPLASQVLEYPVTPRREMADTYFGRTVADPYRWLENLDAPATLDWVRQENGVTLAYLAQLPDRDAIRRRLTTLWDYARTAVPLREAGVIFFRRNAGLQKQSVLYRQARLGAEPVAVLDPNALSPDGSTAVSGWSPSPDGRYLAYTTAGGGSDLRDIHVRDLRTGRDLAGVVPRVKFSGLSWTRDSRGFIYERFRGSDERANLEDANTFHQAWYHTIRGGAPDRLVFDRPDPRDGVGASVSDDGRWLFLFSSSGTSNNRLWLADLGSAEHPDLTASRTVVAPEEDADYIPLGVVGRTLYLRTNWNAPNGRIMAVPVGDTVRAHWRDVVPEGTTVATEAILVGSTLAVNYLADVRSRLQLFDLSGRPLGEIGLPDVGAVTDLSGRNDGHDFFFAFGSYLRPSTIYRCDLRTRALTPFHPSSTPFDPSPYETREEFYTSKDGTRVPIFITARRGLAQDGHSPTLLYGYGGFDISLQPFYSPAVAAWLELGGVFAVANIRGGGEYGEAWHHAGWREHKQNVFDDFIAAAEYLVREGYTTPSRLAIRGASNGGLLVGAVMTQRPDLVGVALPMVGVMDMLRYQKFTGGHFWTTEYGSSDDSSAVGYLLAYSPLQNLRPGVCYPATLVTSADHDDRVVPSHSFKFTATLQADQACHKPVLIRVERTGSHGYRPTDRVIAEIADQYAFALANLRGPAP